MTGDRSLREYDLESGDEAVVDDPLVFLAQPDSIIITKEFAARNSSPGRRSRDVVDDGRGQGVHGARHHAVRRFDQCLWRQPGGHGHLCGPAGVRPWTAVRSNRSETARRARCRRRTNVDPARAGRGLRRRTPGVARPAARIDPRGVCDLDEHLERLRALHRDVHHLQLVLDRRDPAAIGDRHSSRAWRAAAPDQESLSHRERRERLPRLAGRHRRSASSWRAGWSDRSPTCSRGSTA